MWETGKSTVLLNNFGSLPCVSPCADSRDYSLYVKVDTRTISKSGMEVEVIQLNANSHH